jgi:hypothetical protein
MHQKHPPARVAVSVILAPGPGADADVVMLLLTSGFFAFRGKLGSMPVAIRRISRYHFRR